jgi:hypothetical protein
MTDIAFVTHAGSPLGVSDDQLVADVLRARGRRVVPVAWDEATIDWERFAAVVIRSTWDYHRRPDEYAHWLQRLRGDRVNLWNPADAVLANLHKRYLACLAGRGVPVVPTEYLGAARRRTLRAVLEARGWDHVVIKPAVSASAHHTWRSSLDRADADEAQFAGQLRTRDLLVQPYVPEVAAHGEWSLIFFSGRYSHAVLKRPAAGDYRVQRHLGGEAVAAQPPAALMAQAAAILPMIQGPVLYARVDGVDIAGQFTLMELEINEPFLFVGSSPAAAARFADAIEAVL